MLTKSKLTATITYDKTKIKNYQKLHLDKKRIQDNERKATTINTNRTTQRC